MTSEAAKSARPNRGAGRDEVPRRELVSGRRRPKLGQGLFLILPAQVVLLSVVLVPTVLVLWLCMTGWQPTSGTPWYRAEFVWFWNFYDLYFDARFIGAVVRTFLVVALCVVIELLIALVLALLFLEEWPWRKVAVSVIILPMMIVPVDAANAFFMLFNAQGPINYLIGVALGRSFEHAWLADPNWALVPIMLAEIWQWTPLMFLMMLAGLMNLPHNQLRAATALGASPVRIFFRIILPLLTPVIAIALLIRSIETFKIFDPVYILTRGGPGAATETISMYMYTGAFVYFRIGYIAAAALLVLALVVAVCLPLARSLRPLAKT